MRKMTLLIGGDLVPTGSNISYFIDGNIRALFDDKLASLLFSADYRVFNLETPLTDVESPISKDGPNLFTPAFTVNGIGSLKPMVLGLANNHIMDQGEQGLFKTRDLLSDHGIGFIGAGRDISEAAHSLIIEKDGIKVGFYACAENEFSIADGKNPGANPFDPLESPDHIINLKSSCDYVIVLHHGGTEYYRYPSPDLQKVCRKMAEKGADLVICQHSHCVGSFEKYQDSMIVYGQGNFLFDRNDNEFWRSGLLLKVEMGEKMSVDFIPISKKRNGVELSPSEEGEKIVNAFYKRSEEISSPGFVCEEYERYCIENGQYYLATIAGFGKTLRRADKLLKGAITRLHYSGGKLNILKNNIACEAHRELILKYIQIIERKRK